jgi:hypothetical protein
MPALAEGLRLLNRADPFVEVGLTDKGEQLLGAAGEVHLETCVKDLRERFARVDFQVGGRGWGGCFYASGPRFGGPGWGGPDSGSPGLGGPVLAALAEAAVVGAAAGPMGPGSRGRVGPGL